MGMSNLAEGVLLYLVMGLGTNFYLMPYYIRFCITSEVQRHRITDDPIYRLFQITNLMNNSFILQQYVCYTTILNMFRAAPCSSSGGQIVSPQPLVSSLSVNSRTVCRLRLQSALNLHTVRPFTESDDTRCCSDTICSPEDEHSTDRNMLRTIM